MKRSLLLTLMAITGTAILAVALVGFRLSQGGLDYSAFAHIVDYDANTTNDFHVEVDGDADNGTAPCNPVDVAPSVLPGTHKVAICAASAGETVGAFSVKLVYDDTLNQCPDVGCNDGPNPPDPPVVGNAKCLDDNPDANAGATGQRRATARPGHRLGLHRLRHGRAHL